MKYKKNTLDKIITSNLKEIARSSEYRKNGYYLFKKYNNYFLSIFICETGFDNNYISVAGEIKPLFIDNVFWDIMKMSSNKTAPLSFRANGAFTVPSLTIFYQKTEVVEISSVKSIVDNLVKKCNAEFLSVIDKIPDPYQDFVKYAVDHADEFYDIELIEILTSIEKQDYDKAKKIALVQLSKGIKGHFANDGKYVYELVVEYCNNVSNH